MDSISKLVEKFSQFPGVGGRQAKRFVYFLLSQDRERLKELSEIILHLGDNISQCSHCFRFFNTEHNPDTDICSICSSVNTDRTTMMIVAKNIDLENVKKSGTYNGRYFILNGLVPIAGKKNFTQVRTTELAREIKRATTEEDGLKEIIFAFTVNPEGDNTRMFLEKFLEPLVKEHKIKLTTLGRGLSTGTELEYSDDNTLKNALKNRE